MMPEFVFNLLTCSHNAAKTSDFTFSITTKTSRPIGVEAIGRLIDYVLGKVPSERNKGCIPPHILNLDTRRRLMVTFTAPATLLLG